MNQRILTIAEMIRTGMIVADIGTDHAQLPLWLLQQGKAEKAYACDVARGPLDTARKNIAACGFSEQIPVILSDGFDHVPADCDCAVIAGMGVRTAMDILTRARPRLKDLRQLLVQVNDDVPQMRRWVMENGMSVRDEMLVREHGHDYVILDIDTAVPAEYSEEQLLCGPVLTAEKKDILRPYARRQAVKLTAIMAKRGRDDDIQQDLQNRRMLWEKYAK